MAGPVISESNAPAAGLPEGVPPLPADATPEQKDAWWFKHVYQGDRMPQLTLRAVVMGGVLGMLMAASNLYTTLAIGWAFGVAITACVMSFVIWSFFRIISGYLFTRIALVLFWLGAATACALGLYTRLSPMLDSLVGGWGAVLAGAACCVVMAIVTGVVVLLWRRLSPMSILENNCMQSTASAAGYSTGSTLATMFGALLLLAEPGPNQTFADIKNWDIQPIWVVVMFTFCTGLMGVFLAIPLKRQMINHEQLRFPSGTAAAETLRSLYSESKESLKKAYVLIVGIAVGGLVGILNTSEGMLRFLDVYFFDKVKALTGFGVRLPEMLPHDGISRYHGVAPAAFGFESSALLIAAGIITRMRVCLSMFVGSALLYFVVGPWLLEKDLLIAGSGWVQQNGVWSYDKTAHVADTIRNIDLNKGGTILRFTVWSLWGGTAVMVFASLTAIALQWKTVARAFTGLGKSSASPHETAQLKAIEVPTSWMIAGMIPITIAMLFVQVVAFNISWWAGLIAVVLSFFLSLVACRATGETDTTPIGAMGKVMQLLFAVLHPGQIVPNLASAGVAANSASSAADLLTDLKSGYLLGANPRKQFIAQFCGVFFGTLVVVPFWFLMIPTREALEKFAAPGTRQWEAVARVLTKGIQQLPLSAQIAICIGAAIGVLLPIIERYIPARHRKYVPSAMGLGLSWVIPFSSAAGFLVGAVIGWLWEVMHKRTALAFSVAIASGLIAGESLIKAIIAMTATAVGLAGATDAPATATPPAPPAIVQPAQPAGASPSALPTGTPATTPPR